MKLAGGKPTEKTILSTSIGLGGIGIKSESSSSSSLSLGVGVGGGAANNPPPVSYILPTATAAAAAGATTIGGVGTAVGVIYPNLPHPGVTILGGGYAMYPGVPPPQYSTMPPPMMMSMGPMTALGKLKKSSNDDIF